MSATYNLTDSVQMYLSGNDWVGEPTSPSLPQGLVGIDALIYEGAFRMPIDTFGVSTANYSPGPIAYNAANNSIFIAGHDVSNAGSVGEFNIPTVVNSTDINVLNYATNRQGFVRELNRQPYTQTGTGSIISGLHVIDGKLIINKYDFYNNGQPWADASTLVIEDADNLSGTISGYMFPSTNINAAGWVSPIPTEWQTPLGGTHISGFTNSSARASTYTLSVGPSAHVFNAGDVAAQSTTMTVIPATEVLGYTLDNGLVNSADLYNDSLTNNLWTHLSEGSFGMIIPNTDTYMVLGGSAGHVSGMAYGDPPYGGYKGHYTLDENDKYPYYWLYNVNDLVAVKNGSMTPNEVQPYAVGVLPLPFQEDTVNDVAGGSFDPATGKLYLSIHKADGAAPVIVVYNFGGVS